MVIIKVMSTPSFQRAVQMVYPHTDSLHRAGADEPALFFAARAIAAQLGPFFDQSAGA